MTEPHWEMMARKFAEPFDPQDVDWRPQGNSEPNKNCQVVCYVDARAVMDRLDAVVGCGNWSFTYEPLVTANGQVQIAKGRLTIHGVSKEDVGEASNFDASKGCVSDALKRAAVMWGIGRYLYAVPPAWVTMDQHKRIPPAELAKLRAHLSSAPGRVADSPVEPRPPVRKAPAITPIRPAPPVARAPGFVASPLASTDQLKAIVNLCRDLGHEEPTGDITTAEAREIINTLSAEKRARRQA